MLLVDLGGVLIPDRLPAAAATWSTLPGLTPQEFLGALFGISDDQVLSGRQRARRPGTPAGHRSLGAGHPG